MRLHDADPVSVVPNVALRGESDGRGKIKTAFYCLHVQGVLKQKDAYCIAVEIETIRVLLRVAQGGRWNIALLFKKRYEGHQVRRKRTGHLLYKGYLLKLLGLLHGQLGLL